MEKTFAELERTHIFQTFTTKEKAAYRDSLNRLRDLIHDLEQDSAQKEWMNG